MGGFLVAVRSDIFLALRSRALAVLFLVPAAAAFLRIALGKLQSAGQEAQRALIGQASAAAGELTGYAAFVDGSATGLTICYLLLVALAAHSLSFERDQGVIRHVLIRRVSRRALVVARFCSLTAVGGLFTLVVFVASWCAASLFYEFAPVVEDGYEIIGVAEMRAEILVGLKLALVPLPAVVAFGIFVSTWARSAAAAVGVAFGATLGLDLFKGLLPFHTGLVLIIWTEEAQLTR